jgi:hypothetical protein
MTGEQEIPIFREGRREPSSRTAFLPGFHRRFRAGVMFVTFFVAPPS